MKIAYIGIDLLYPALPALWDAGCEIAEIFTCKTDNETEFNLQVCAFAKEHGVPLSTGKIKREDLRRLKAGGCHAVISAGYYHRIPIDPGLKMVNIHPALLPVGRGAWPMPVTILNGLKESGVTVHKLTEAYDEGDILLQERIAVAADEDLKTLTAKQQALLPDMMRKLAADFDLLYKNAAPQGEGEYWPYQAEDSIPITPDMTVTQADLILRAFYGYECVYNIGSDSYGMIGGKAGAAGDFPLINGFITATSVRKR
jgi:methionyl-tRNA formyltransferase